MKEESPGLSFCQGPNVPAAWIFTARDGIDEDGSVAPGRLGSDILQLDVAQPECLWVFVGLIRSNDEP